MEVIISELENGYLLEWYKVGNDYSIQKRNREAFTSKEILLEKVSQLLTVG